MRSDNEIGRCARGSAATYAPSQSSHDALRSRCASTALALLALASVACSTPAENPDVPDVTRADIVSNDVASDTMDATIDDRPAPPDASEVDVATDQATTDSQVSCPMGLVLCSGSCVDPNTDRNNCGTCGRMCAAAESCSAGSCVARCPLGQTRCGADCVDTSVDLMNCGACGRACAARERCVMSSCVPDCPAGQSACGGACVDTRTSDAHCGACNNACAASETCVTGMCRPRCPAGQSFCGGACVDVQTSNTHCGTCGNACPSGQSCSMGVCSITCMPPTMRCGGLCVDTTTSAANCGACGTTCPGGANATAACAASRCSLVCATGFANCDGVATNGCEVDTRTSMAHCGACGRVCAAGANQTATCSTGSCVLRCTAGFGDCDGNPTNGCETNLNTSVANCSACGRACVPPAGGSASCSAASCTSSCGVGLSLCGASMSSPGRCANLQTDAANCGACGVVCPGSQSCVAGACRALCAPGQTACGPSMTCVDLQSNAANCGACGVVCPPGQSCGNGTCLAPFRVTSFSASCNLVNTEALQGDQRGGLAVSSSYLLVNADQGAARFDPITVANAPQLVPEQIDGAVYDVFSGQLFLLGDSAGPMRLGTGLRTIDRLWRTNSGTWVTSSPLMLSRSIAIDSNYGANVGVYSGGGRVVVHTTNVYDINLTSGLVTDRGVMAQPTRTFAENFRTTGVAEQIGGTLYLTYVQSAGAISRSRVPDGLVTNVATFGGLGLGDAAHLAVNSAGTSSRWLVRIEGGGQFGSIAEALVSCPVTVTQNTTTGDFSMSGYSAAGCTVIDTNAEVGDDRGPLAVSYGSAYIVGDSGSRRYFSATAPSAMNSSAIGGVMDHVVYNVRNGALFGLYAGDLPLQAFSGSVSVTRLVPLAEFSLQPSGTPLTLSQPIPINTGASTSNMVFNGWDRVVIGTDTRLWNINLANGEVRDLGPWTAPTHTYNEMWAATGIAESTGSATDLVYVQSTTAIGRMRVGTGAVSIAGSFTNLGDTATIGFSPSRNRWYMQFEYTNQFVATPSAEWVASCAGTFAN